MSSAFFLLGTASPVREKLRALYASSINYGEGSVNISNQCISPFSSVYCCFLVIGGVVWLFINTFIRFIYISNCKVFQLNSSFLYEMVIVGGYNCLMVTSINIAMLAYHQCQFLSFFQLLCMFEFVCFVLFFFLRVADFFFLIYFLFFFNFFICSEFCHTLK